MFRLPAVSAKLRLLLFLLYLATIVAVSLLPLGTDSAKLRLFNNIMHAPVYAVFVLMLSGILKSVAGLNAGRRFFISAFSALAVGAAVELAQFAVANRSSSLSDLALNAAGVAAGLSIMYFRERRK
ncbi:MAG TPA: hypothetical protein DEE98_01900 [Elusimicrobia bacterium]|nr:MAG: hypothetical protein A2278_05700 [Elusimicrobia bacterium RIFOXYA12_FULL_49_49]OGS07358.1 MAG: hypothetical protein A2204_01865 [Elusimicrobia bacterium RIFOXYA1_FULL_47_7]OGS11361.1 MAG: hypothetical protein A2386_07800 [Elusimicrobia bacterium RIFOXYB1_FULL_48_9]OGS15402.1 MAG: hypothetical protein A2251_07530 [Elusimicrobia bacterium RIFOXYA2_FULL_47_53]OGS26258.1 MAG: hypothetical protein A2339_01530 [Elusimicrobia bacterium RIFOXYB12_FULL_50_12]OGS30830.1 MAG: hypothetical protein